MTDAVARMAAEKAKTNIAIGGQNSGCWGRTVTDGFSGLFPHVHSSGYKILMGI